MKSNKAQNIIEYIFLVVAVVCVCILLMLKNGPIHRNTNDSLKTMVNQIDQFTNEIQITSRN